jgi:hypothetical protein
MNTVGSTTTTINLTPAQRRFAEQHDAAPGISMAWGVLLYREMPEVTHRWLVDGDGRCIEAVELLRAA